VLWATPDRRPTGERVLVTGAAGFIGAGAVRRLLELGFAVDAVVHPQSDAWRLRGLSLPVHTLDLADADAVRGLLESLRPDRVLHLAAHGTYHWQEDARGIVESNVLGSYHLFEAAARASVRLLVNAGSSSEYGYRDEPMREADRVEPNSVYAVSKAAQTSLCRLVSVETGCPMVTFRLFSVYGPWEEPRRLVPTAIRRARAGEPLEMVGPDTARDFVYVEDVLDALTDFARYADYRGEVFNLGSGVQTTMRDFVGALDAALGTRTEVRWSTLAPRRWDATCWQADVSKSARLLGWTPRHGLVEGLRATARWMADHAAA
jgi:nucleoside-diphosphate-sugar epimerase